MVDQTANFVRGEADSSIAAGDTAISVVNASEFPDPANGEYNLVLWDDSLGRPDQDSDAEIVRVTGRDTTNDNLTVTRAQEGTSDVSHPSGSALQLGVTAKVITDLEDNITTQTGSATISDGGIATPISGFDLSAVTNVLSVQVIPDAGTVDLNIAHDLNTTSSDINYYVRVGTSNNLTVPVENNAGQSITVTAVVLYKS